MLGRRASVFAFTDDIPFYPGNYDEVRWPQFLIRGALILVLVAVAFFPVLDSGALWIDEADAGRELFLRTNAGVARLWRPTSQATYQPLADTLLAAQYRFWFQRPGGYHAISVLLHAGNAVLVWLLLRRLSVPGAWLGAAVFALHPAQVQAAAFIGGQAQLWMTLFFVSALILYLRFLSVEPDPPVDPTVVWLDDDAGGGGGGGDTATATAPPEEMTVPLHPLRWLFYALSLVLFLAAVGCGTAAACFPAVVLLILWWRHGGALRSDFKPLAPFLAVSALSYVVEFVRAWRISAAADAAHASIVDRVFGAGRALFAAAQAFFWPVNNVYAHPSWQADGRPAWYYAFLPLAILIFAALWALRRRGGKGPLAALAFVALVLVPPLLANGHGWTTRAPLADHHQYLADIGLIALAVGGVIGLASRLAIGPARTLRFAVGFVVVVAASALAFGRARTFADSATVWDRVVARYPTFIEAHQRLVGIHLERKQYDKAQRSAEVIARARPDDPGVWVELGALYENRGDADEAVRQYLWALRIDPDHPRANVKLGVLRQKQRRLPEAESYLRRGVDLAPTDPAVRDELGEVYRLQGRGDEAIKEYEAAIKIDPYAVRPRIHLAQVYFARKDFELAAKLIQEAARIDPRNYDAFMAAGSMLAAMGDYERSERMFRYAARIRQDSYEAHNSLGLSLFAQNRYSEAIYSFRRAIELRADFSDAKRNLIEAEHRRKLGPSTRPTRGPGLSLDPPRRGVGPSTAPASVAPVPGQSPSSRPATAAPAKRDDPPPAVRPTTLPGGR